MVAALGGRLLIDDQPGKGTTATAKKPARAGVSERADW
jgi:signal transduction histidine kinase